MAKFTNEKYVKISKLSSEEENISKSVHISNINAEYNHQLDMFEINPCLLDIFRIYKLKKLTIASLFLLYF